MNMYITKKKINTFLFTLLFALLLSFSIMLSGCNGQAQPTGNSINSENIASDVEKIEIIHFHGTNQCPSCIAVGDLAEETIKVYFPKDLESGKVSFAHINGELPENYELVKKYGVTGSSLWIGTYMKDGQFKAEQNINVWYKINDKNDYMTYLSGVIEQKLGVSS